MPMRRRHLVGHGASWAAFCLSAGRAGEAQSANAARAAPVRSDEPGTRSVAADAAFPLIVSPNGRYLVDRNRRPFFIVGDSAQSIYSSIAPKELGAYLARRRSQGFNTLLAEPLHYLDNSGRVLPSADGNLPFLKNVANEAYRGELGSADFSTPNPAYWDYVDAVLDQAQARGFLVIQYVVSWGAQEEPSGALGWLRRHAIPFTLRETALWANLEKAVSGEPQGSGLWKDLTNIRNTEAVCLSFGQWLGKRYRDRSNILWLDGSDFNGNAVPIAPDRTSGVQRALAVSRGMREAGALQLRSGDWKPETLSTDEAAFASLMDVNGVYTYGGDALRSTYRLARRGYQYSPPKPAYLKETGYEAEDFIPGDPASVRKYEWWSILSGSTAGLIYGHAAIWPFTPGRWEAALDSPGSLDVARIAALMNSVAWQDLAPSELAGMRRLVVSSNGSQEPSIANYVAAAQTPDGALLMAYVPPYSGGPQRLTLDLRSMRGPSRARWWDPTSADFTPIGNKPSDGFQEFTTPGTNRGGSNDWVLMLDA